MKTKLIRIAAVLAAHGAAGEPLPVAHYSWTDETIADGVD